MNSVNPGIVAARYLIFSGIEAVNLIDVNCWQNL